MIVAALALAALYLLDAVPYGLYGHMLAEQHTKLVLLARRLVGASSPIEIMLPTVLTVLFGIYALSQAQKMSRGMRCTVIFYTFALHSVYIVFRLGALNLNDPANTAASLVLLAAELTHYCTMFCFYVQMVWPLNRSAQADAAERRVVSGDFLPTVAILIPTYNESVQVLRRTLIGCQALCYPSDRFSIYLLDDRGREKEEENEAVEALAAQLRCNYITRENNDHAKAGNLNNALTQISEDLVAFFDCDNVPCMNFLTRMVGFFEDPKVALAISSLHYFNTENSGKNIGIEMLVASDHAKALSNGQAGRDTFNGLLCFGTSYIIRRRVLDDLGGIPTETLCEDWATSIRIQAMGYKTIFLDEVLSTGLAAEDLKRFVQQRLRWCQGTLQALFVATNPLTIPGLNIVQRVVHFFGILYYLMYVATFVSLLIPLLYFYFGVVPIEATLEQFAFFFLPFFLMQNFMYAAFSARFSSLISSQIADYLLCVPLTIVVLKTLSVPFGARFKVTDKGFKNHQIKPLPLLSFSMLGIFVLYAVGLVVGYENAEWFGVGAPFAAFALWGLYRMIFFWMAFHASTNLPQHRDATRFEEPGRCLFFGLDGTPRGAGEVRNISESGVEVVDLEGRIPKRGLLSIPHAKIDKIVFRKARDTKIANGYGLKFTDPTLVQHRRIIEFLYCGAGRWGQRYLSERSALNALSRFLSGVERQSPG